MDYKRRGSDIALRLDTGEEITEALAALAEAEGVPAAQISGIGALSEMEVSVYDLDKKRYSDRIYREPLELISLAGTVTERGGKPHVHLHACAGGFDGKVYGGHLKRGIISATGEIVLRVLDVPVGRKINDATGLWVFDFKD